MNYPTGQPCELQQAGTAAEDVEVLDGEGGEVGEAGGEHPQGVRGPVQGDGAEGEVGQAGTEGRQQAQHLQV